MDDCIEWDKARNKHGYGVQWYDGRTRLAHRVTFALAHPDVEIEGRIVRHLCHNPPCVNVLHLACGSQGENIADSIRDGRRIGRPRAARCKRGHIFDEANTYHYRGRQHCRLCRSQEARERRKGQGCLI